MGVGCLFRVASRLGWWASSLQRPWGWRATCGSALGRGCSVFVGKPAAKAPGALSGLAPGRGGVGARQGTSWGQVRGLRAPQQHPAESGPGVLRGPDLEKITDPPPPNSHLGRSQHFRAPTGLALCSPGVPGWPALLFRWSCWWGAARAQRRGAVRAQRTQPRGFLAQTLTGT